MTLSMASKLIDIKQTFFDYPDLTKITKITGKPTLISLLRFKNNLKDNAQSIPLTLGGGNYGNLGLVLTTAEYETVAHGTPYNKLTLPVLYTGTTNTQYQLTQKRNECEKAMLLLKEL